MCSVPNLYSKLANLMECQFWKAKIWILANFAYVGMYVDAQKGLSFLFAVVAFLSICQLIVYNF